MKYNFDYTKEDKKIRTKEDHKMRAIEYTPRIYYNNYESNNYDVFNIKPLWLRSKFKGSNTELLNHINSIKKLKNGRSSLNEEECLFKLSKTIS